MFTGGLAEEGEGQPQKEKFKTGSFYEMHAIDIHNESRVV